MAYRRISAWSALYGCTALAALSPLSATQAQPTASTSPLRCDASLKTMFRPDAHTSVTLVKAFKKGEPLTLSGTADPKTPIANNDLCVVKLNVGPGNPGPVGAPSTSRGIGIEIWLPAPANWNNRLHAMGGGGWQGVPGGDPDALYAFDPFGPPLAGIAGREGAVTSFTDTGHGPADGSFAMTPEGKINEALWRDFSDRSLYEQAVKTRALATAYYGRAPKYAYWEGASTGGRQGLKVAQAHPELYDGIVANMPAIHFAPFVIAGLWPQLVFARDLGGVPLTAAQQDLVSNAAINACDMVGGKHLGFVLDNATCRYDPTLDKAVLCTAEGGTNGTPACVTHRQALAMNKIWYGPTTDGSVPSPAVDNGWQPMLTGKHLWYGLPRGTATAQIHINAGGQSFLMPALAAPTDPFDLGADMIALTLQDPKLASPKFKNATGNGAQAYRNFSYADYARAFAAQAALQPQFSNINTDSPDLSAFRKRGGKLITAHGTNDELIMVQASIDYYHRVIKAAGGLAAAQNFYRLYLVPGTGHGSANGTANRAIHPPMYGDTLFYDRLTDWVEKGIAPDRLDIASPPGSPASISQPLCVFPRQARYQRGDPAKAASYTCG